MLQNKQADGLTAFRLRLVTFLVTGSLFMEVLDGTIIATALPEMATSFGLSAVELNVGISAYLLALGVLIPVSGWFADRFGPRLIFTSAIALFTLSSALCGLSTDLPTFIALRILQGASGAMMVPVGRLLILRYTPQDKLMGAMSSLVWPALAAPVIGPPLGGFITTHAGWHWIFFLNVPLGLIAFVAALFLVPRIQPEARQPFDWRGFVLCGTATFAVLSGLERLAAAVTAVNLALIGGGLLMGWLALRHLRRASAPMLTLAPFRIATFRAAMVGGSISRMAIGSAPFLLPLLFQVGFGYSPFHSGLLLLVVFAGNFAMKSVTTPVLRRFGYRPVLIANSLLAAACLAACAILTPDTPLVVLLLVLFINGVTRSMQFTALGTIAFADVEKQQMADANGLFNTLSQIAMAAGITLGAIGVRLGEMLAGQGMLTGDGVAYRAAFLLAACVGVLGVVDLLRLPRGAGDHFIEKSTDAAAG